MEQFTQDNVQLHQKFDSSESQLIKTKQYLQEIMQTRKQNEVTIADLQKSCQQLTAERD